MRQQIHLTYGRGPDLRAPSHTVTLVSPAFDPHKPHDRAWAFGRISLEAHERGMQNGNWWLIEGGMKIVDVPRYGNSHNGKA
jgi:hypothetical protein